MKAWDLDTVDLIQREAEVPGLARRLGSGERLAVDTESNSLFAYREQVCLIQFSTSEEDFLVDPLAIADLSALGPLFGNPGIEKIFHAAEYDLLCLRRDFGFETVNLFDTMAAARILGRKEIGLGALLEAEFGVKVEKRHQRANWGQRPLPGYLLDYARMDTHYLIALRDRLAGELAERNLMPLAQEDFRRLATNNREGDEDLPGADRPVDCWRVSGSYDLNPHQAAVLQELCKYRDEAARRLDRPLFKVINDHTLLAIASEMPRSIEELRKLPGMSARQIQHHGESLLRSVQRGMEATPVRPPRSTRPDPAFSERLDALRNWRKKAAAEMGVPSDVVLPRDLMKHLAYQNPGNFSELEKVMQSVPWRTEHFGEQILRALAGGER